MKLTIDKSADIKSTNSKDEQINFRVEASAAMFDTLTKNIYAKPMESMIRELISNAHDSHVAANNVKTPIDVHVPNAVEPYFEVRDYGVSLSPEEVINVYTVFFKSSKNNTNTQIGGFGLGAKLPFAYQDQFTVTTWLNGVKTIYLACKENGVPVLKTILTTESDEPQGLSVNVAVKDQDTSDFRSLLAEFSLLSGFNMNYSDKTVCQKAELDENLTKMFRKFNKRVSVYDALTTSGLAKIRLGGVLYTIDLHRFESTYCSLPVRLTEEQEKELDEISDERNVFKTTIYSQDYHKSIVLDFDVGELQPTASRESLQLTYEQAQQITFDMVKLRKEVIKEVVDNSPSSEDDISDEEAFEYWKTYYPVAHGYDAWMPALADRNFEIFRHKNNMCSYITVGRDFFEEVKKDGKKIVKRAKIYKFNTWEGTAEDKISYSFYSNASKLPVYVVHESLNELKNSTLSKQYAQEPEDKSFCAIIQLTKNCKVKDYIDEFKEQFPLELQLIDLKELPDGYATNVKKSERKSTNPVTKSKTQIETDFIKAHQSMIDEFGFIPVIDFDLRGKAGYLNDVGLNVCYPANKSEYNRVTKYDCVKIFDFRDRKTYMKYIKKCVLVGFLDEFRNSRFCRYFPEKIPECVINAKSKLDAELDYKTVLGAHQVLTCFGIYNKADLNTSIKKHLSTQDLFLYLAVDMNWHLDDFIEGHKGETLNLQVTL